MADEIFALSPIAARPVQPSEQDYDAIKEAFMETSRGRWFLGEYAKRNRNADTRMVLDAVARIEETIAAQKKPVRDPLLDQALASFRVALAEARDAASAAVDGLAIEQNLAPVRKGARVIREIAWRLREIGADGRICDLIDSQVAAIEDAAGRLNPTGFADMLDEAFDRIEGRIAAFDGSDTAPAASAPIAEAPAREAAEAASVPEAEAEDAEAEVETVARAEAQTPAETLAPPDETIDDSTVAGDADDETEAATETKAEARTETDIETTAEAAIAAASAAAVTEEPAAAAPEAADEPTDDFDASDEAMLDMVALEMAAPDTDEAYEPKLEDIRADVEAELQIQARQLEALQVQETPAEKIEAEKPEILKSEAQKSEANAVRESAASWEIDVTFGSDAASAVEEPALAVPPLPVAALQVEAEPQPALAAAPSLGSNLIASGIVTRPRPSGPDPMAPIRRMSQNEKIAFFS